MEKGATYTYVYNIQLTQDSTTPLLDINPKGLIAESYDQPRQHIKKQKHYFANKGPSSQGYGFSSGHVMDMRGRL